MSASQTIMPDDTAITQEQAIPEDVSPEQDYGDVDEEEVIPLNAEEATVLVLSFLKRMRKRIITPRKAVLTNSIFVVDVELKDATAVVHINRETREVVEYTIQPEVKEPKPLPIPPRRILMVLGAVTAIIVVLMLYTFFRANLLYLIQSISQVNSDYLIVGAAVLGVAAVVIWWRRRG
ncbi:MAG: hypothetical protein JSV18_06470 [Candidatus Bathyarchaeota archaeon]|nr:MAG: hypothetical protein JSV18_06470 [Candidatus Bathyarchaeota archaeon]